MSPFKSKVSLEVLPPDAMTLKDDQFYSLVEKLTSIDIARIFKCQFVNSINTFLLCKNVLAPILLPTSTFEPIRRDICVKLNQNHNNSYVVHVGITGQVEYLTELFLKKQLQEAMNTPKHRSSASSPLSNPSFLSTTSSSIITTSTPSSISTTSTPSSIITTSTPSSISTTSTPSSIITTSTPSSIITTSTSLTPPNFDYRSHIISSINKWITSQKKIHTSNTLQMVEGDDYALQLSSSAQIASIICQCNTRITVRKSSDNIFLLSNLFKHWNKSTKCNVLSSKLSTSTDISSLSSSSNGPVIDDDDQDSSSSLSTELNTQTTNKRTMSSIRSTQNSTSPKRRRNI
jgi:hypothetical protein